VHSTWNSALRDFREEYCRGSYAWCGRYMGFKAVERELRRQSPSGILSQTPDKTRGEKQAYSHLWNIV